MSIRNSQKILKLTIFCIIEILLILVVLEIYLRFSSTVVSQNGKGLINQTGTQLFIKETPLGKRLIPNTHTVISRTPYSGYTIHMDINSLGFRDDEFSQDKKDKERRILVLGDSITFGNALESDQIFTERAEYYLNTNNQNTPYQVINAGVGDVRILEEIAILKEQGFKVDPDIVVLAFYLNDSRPPWGFTGEIGHRGWLRRHSVLAETVWRNLVLKQWIKEKGLERFKWYTDQFSLDWKHDPLAFSKLAASADVDWGAAWQPDSWIVVRTYLDELESLAQTHRFRVVVMVFPVSFQVYTDYLEDSPQRMLNSEAEKRGFSYLDLLPILRQHQDKTLFFDHAHPNVDGNDIIGKALADFLISHD